MKFHLHYNGNSKKFSFSTGIRTGFLPYLFLSVSIKCGRIFSHISHFSNFLTEVEICRLYHSTQIYTTVHTFGVNLVYASDVLHSIPHGTLCPFIAGVGVNIEGHTHIGMAHEILQALEVDPAVCHLGTEGMPQRMGRDGGQLVLVGVVIPVHHPLHHMLQMHGHLMVLLCFAFAVPI